MSPTYYIYSTKMMGWVTASFTWTTATDQLKPFTYAEAIEFCRARGSEGKATCLPVVTDMLRSVENAL